MVFSLLSDGSRCTQLSWTTAGGPCAPQDPAEAVWTFLRLRPHSLCGAAGGPVHTLCHRGGGRSPQGTVSKVQAGRRGEWDPKPLSGPRADTAQKGPHLIVTHGQSSCYIFMFASNSYQAPPYVNDQFHFFVFIVFILFFF